MQLIPITKYPLRFLLAVLGLLLGLGGGAYWWVTVHRLDVTAFWISFASAMLVTFGGMLLVRWKED